MQNKNVSLLTKDEEKTREMTRKSFVAELSFFEANSELFLETFKILGKNRYKRFSYSEDATFRIAYRIFRIMRCAVNNSLEGYYDVATALTRMAYESHLLMHYLSENEGEAKLWFNGKSFAPIFIRKNVSYSSDSLYREMSECIHSSLRSTSLFTRVYRERTKALIGEYDKERFRQVIILALMAMATTMIWVSMMFAQDLMSDEEWHCLFNNTIPKMWKHLRKTSKTD